MTHGWWLFARSRRTLSAVLIITGLGLVERLLGAASLKLSHDNSLSIPWTVITPAIAATVIGASTRSVMGRLEQRTVRSLAGLRATHLTAMLLIAVIVTTVSSTALAGDISAPAALRNLIGFTGLALISATILGGNLAWPLPIGVALATLTAGASQGRPRTWAWPIHHNQDASALLVATLLLVLGGALVISYGTREPLGDAV